MEQIFLTNPNPLFKILPTFPISPSDATAALHQYFCPPMPQHPSIASRGVENVCSAHLYLNISAGSEEAVAYNKVPLLLYTFQ